MADDFEILTDESVMPGTGKHAGKKMVNVPADYLIWCWENGKCSRSVAAYVTDNMDVLRLQVKQSNKFNLPRPKDIGMRIDYAPRKRKPDGRRH